MKKTGILHAQLMGELTKMRHTDKIMICDVGFPVPDGKTLVDVSLVAGVPAIEQVFKAICNEILIESLTFPEGFSKVHSDFYQELQSRFQNHKFVELTSTEFFQRAYDADVKLFVRTGDVRPCGNILLSSASGVPMVFDKYNVEFEYVVDGKENFYE